MRNLVLAIAIAVPASASSAADDEIYGTYRLISSTREIVATGEVIDTFGKNPKGFITYGRDGRMLVLITADGRAKPESLAKMTDVQRADLFRTMAAYGGTYKFDGNKIAHHIDISWNEVWNETTVIRDIRKEGGRLVYTTRPAPFSADGKVSVTTLIWEKVQP